MFNEVDTCRECGEVGRCDFSASKLMGQFICDDCGTEILAESEGDGDAE